MRASLHLVLCQARRIPLDLYIAQEVMNSNHICSTCRRSLLAKVCRESTPQSRAASSFVSFRNPQTTTDGKSLTDLPLIGEVGSFRDDKNERLYVPRLWRRPKPLRNSHADLLESLFEEGLTTTSQGRPVPSHTEQNDALRVYGHLETVKRLLQDDKPIEEIWQVFVSHLGPAAWISGDKSIPKPPSFAAVTGILLRRLVLSRRKSQTVAGLPSVTDILTTYASLGLQRLTAWNDLVSDLINKLSIQLSEVADDSQIHEGDMFRSPTTRAGIISTIEDLMGAWRFLLNYYGAANGSFYVFGDDKTAGRFWRNVPSQNDLLKAKMKGIEHVFQSQLSHFPRYHLKGVSSAALITFALLTNEPATKVWYQCRDDPFITATARLLIAAQITPVEIKNLLISQTLAGFETHISVDWSSVLLRAEDIAKIPTTRHVQLEHQAIRPSATSSLIHNKLAEALSKRDLAKVDRLWALAQTYARVQGKGVEQSPKQLKSIDADPRSEIASATDPFVLSQGLCNQFIFTYIELRLRDRAVDVWNFMIENSIQPTLTTWNSMLEGCKRARNSKSLETVWAKLRASGLQPNMVCWTTRISGLIASGHPEHAVLALDEMGRDWIQATKHKKVADLKSAGDIDGYVKPTIETINAAISGLLLRANLSAYAYRILAWGDKFGIKPDIITFNTLLRALVRDGRTDAVKALLEQMQKQGIHADVATFTIILEEIFRTNARQTPEQQMEMVNSVFAEMEAAGVQANLHTYSKIIYSLLHSQAQCADMAAVKAVMRRMAAQGLKPSTHLYTMLINHHFTKNPPDFESIRFILEQVKLSGVVMDHIFWDRVIEGYARLGDTSSALNILGRVDKEESRVGWPALQMVISALAENGEWDLAKQVVRNVRTDRGAPPGKNEKGVEGQHSFWNTVADLRLLEA